MNDLHKSLLIFILLAFIIAMAMIASWHDRAVAWEAACIEAGHPISECRR